MAVKIVRKPLKVLALNCQAIQKQKYELETYLQQKGIDIALFSETFLKATHHFKLRNYLIYRKDRPTRGGGTAVAIKREIPHDHIDLPPLLHFEGTGIKVI